MITRAAARRQRRNENLVYPVHSLNQQPNVILDLIFSFLDLCELEYAVFPLSRRIAAHLLRPPFLVDADEMELIELEDIDKFYDLADRWNLRSLSLVCFFNYSLKDDWDIIESPETQGWARMRWLDIGEVCPKLQEAAIYIDFEVNLDDNYSKIDSFIGSFSGCRFLRSFDYCGPAVPSLGLLKQLERLKLELGMDIESFYEILENLRQLRSIVFRENSFDLEDMTILQDFPALEEIELKNFSSRSVAKLVQIPRLKTLIIDPYKKIDFLPNWSDFRTLERLVLKLHALEGNSSILPEIRSLKEVEISEKSHWPLPWLWIQKFLSFNLQVELLTVHLSSDQVAFDEENLSQLAQFLEIHQNINKFRVMKTSNDHDYEAFSGTNVGLIYSRCFTDRFLFRSPGHRQDFIKSLRKLGKARTSSVETRSMKRQRLETETNRK